jgi:3-deoxy-7-phosphoheptulonate synthase
MIIVLKPGATEAQVRHIEETIREWKLTPHISRGSERTIIGVIGDESVIAGKPLDVFPGVERVMPVLKPYKLASAEHSAERTRITIPPVKDGAEEVVIGGETVVTMAGPCSVESRGLLLEIANVVKDAGGRILRGGAFKPRTSPYSFQGLGERGIEYLHEVRAETGLPVITEVMDPRQVELVAEKADVLQIGARNVQNFNLLTAVGEVSKPVMIKRGMSSTINELLMSAEYVMSRGNAEVILCERGIRTYETMTRNTLDMSAVPVLKRESHLPVIVDPSHATGHWDLVAPMALAAVAAGADGIMVEIHPTPEQAPCDGSQALLPRTYAVMMEGVRRVADAIGRSA